MHFVDIIINNTVLFDYRGFSLTFTGETIITIAQFVKYYDLRKIINTSTTTSKQVNSYYNAWNKSYFVTLLFTVYGRIICSSIRTRKSAKGENLLAYNKNKITSFYSIYFIIYYYDCFLFDN